MSDNSGAIDPATGHSGNAHTGAPYEQGPEHSHDRLDGKDQRSHANNIEDAVRIEKKEEKADNEPNIFQTDPTAVAKAHGNKPSRGAKKDKEIIDDEEEELRKKEEAKQQSRAAKGH